MSAGTLCSGRQSPFLEVRFDRRLPRREAEHPWQARSDQSCIEQSATPSYGRDAFGLAKNSSVWLFRDLVCHDIFYSCALMRFFTVGHQVCDCDLSASSTQLKNISWPGPPGYKVSSSSLSLSAPSTASLSASAWSGSSKWPWTFTKRVREDDSDRNLSSLKMSWMMSYDV